MNPMSVIFSVFNPEEGQKDPHADTRGEAVILPSAAGVCGKNDRSNEKTAFKIKQEMVISKESC